VETTDLTELNINNIQEGDAVKITFDAIPGLELSGTVLRIQSLGQNKQGDITYKVTVKLDKQDDRLRWNMTALVAFANKP
jgi:HlyD family secretion protein